MGTKPSSYARRSALRIAGLYVAVALAWIAGSDLLIKLFVTDPELLTRLQSAKGSVFVVATGLMLYMLIRREIRRIEDSEQRFRTLIDAAPIGIVVAKGGNVIYSNPAYLHIFGLSDPDAMLGKSLLDHIAPGHRDEIRERNRQRERGEAVPMNYETVGLRNDGRTFPMSIRSTIIDLDGPVTLAFATDIAERKHLERRLIDARDVYLTLVDEAPMLIWRTDATGRCDFVNRQFAEFIGNAPEAAFGFGWMEYIATEDRETTQQAVQAALAAHTSLEHEYRMLHHDGSYRWMITRGNPYFDQAGQYAGYVGTSTDISEHKRQEQMKDDFLALASHELKTPLTTMMGYVYLLQRWNGRPGSEKKISYGLSMLIEEGGRLERLINDLLDVSRIQSDRLKITLRPINLTRVITHIVSSFQLAVPNNLLEFDPPPDPIIVAADQDRIEQVVTNLLTNAVKYSPLYAPVTVKLCAHNGCAELSIRDRGIGIPQADLPHIFDRFYQVRRPPRESRPGLGLGLYIAHEIVRHHGGTIMVHSEEDQGSSFTIRLPMRQPSGEELIEYAVSSD